MRARNNNDYTERLIIDKTVINYYIGGVSIIKSPDTDTLSMGKIVIKKTSNDGYHFTIVANNGQVVGVSQTYKSLKSAKNGIDSVKRNRNSYIEDQTVPDYEELGFPKWQIFKDAAGEYRFRLVAMNGETVLAASEGYTRKESAINGMDSVRKNLEELNIVGPEE